MKRISGNAGTKRLFINAIVFVALGTTDAGFSAISANAANHVVSTPQSNTRGGEIAVYEKSAGMVELASNRFTCESCAIHVIPKIKALGGVKTVKFGPFVGSSKSGSAINGLIGTLTVLFDPDKIAPNAIALAAKRALESDPYNKHSVRLVYRTASKH